MNFKDVELKYNTNKRLQRTIHWIVKILQLLSLVLENLFNISLIDDKSQIFFSQTKANKYEF